MTNDPLANAYLKVIEEETHSSGVADETKKQVGKTFGDAESEKKAKDVEPASATENADKDLEDAKEDKEHSAKSSDGAAKTLQKSSYSNPFDALYNKILQEEEAFNFSTEDNSLQPDSTFDADSNDNGLEEFDDESEEDGAEEVSISMDRETAQKLYDLLGGVLSSEEAEESEEGEEVEEIGDEGDETEEEELKQEAVEAEVVGHALVDAEKLNKGMNNPANKVVKGAVPVTSKTAETAQGAKDADGELKQHSTEPAVKKLQSKKQDVGAVHVGKTLFDNK